jgi:hypothetical protein
MNRIDLIIDALIAFDVMAHEQKIAVYIKEAHKAIAAARELKALKPMAWMDKEDCGDMRFTSVEPTYENDLIPLYALEVTK